ncbi:MAG: hypothetical protein NW207_02805 [Cytophagales bacterium]|nr:hypothetical protein [Cytophagales bacterium]
MKKVIITASILALGYAASWGQNDAPAMSNSLFHRYINKSLYTKVNFANENVEGLYKVKFNVNETGIDSVQVEGADSNINKQLEKMVMNTPKYIVGVMQHSHAKKCIVPIRLVVRKD